MSNTPETFKLELPEGPATLETRIMLELACQKSLRMRTMVRERAMQDCEWFVDYLLWTYDPRGEAAPHHLPFILYPHQRDFLAWLEEQYQKQEDGLLEKSRDMGATWLTLAWIAHKWLYEEGFMALLGSRKEELVSDGTLDSLFGRIDYLLRRLPSWLLPRGFEFDSHFLRLRIINPATGNTIKGESANAQFSRQGRYSLIFMDEGAFWEDLEKSWRATGDASDFRFICSTPNLDDWKFQELRDSGMAVYTLYWRQHPKKDDAWYEKQKLRKSEADLQQELEINYNPTTTGTVYPQWEKITREQVQYDPKLTLYASMDFGIGDDTAIIWAQRDPVTGDLLILECYSNKDQPIDFYVPFLLGEIPTHAHIWTDPDDPEAKPVTVPWPHSYTPEEIQLIAKVGGWGVPILYGDPAARQRSQATGDSVMSILRRYGLHLKVNDTARDWYTRYTTTQLLIRNVKLNYPTCSQLDEAIRHSRFPDDRNNRRRTATMRRPVHDRHSHYRTALEYLAVNLPPLVQTRRFAPDQRKMAYDRIY